MTIHDDLEAEMARDLKWYQACVRLTESCRANVKARRRAASERSAKGWQTRRGA